MCSVATCGGQAKALGGKINFLRGCVDEHCLCFLWTSSDAICDGRAVPMSYVDEQCS